MLQGLFSFLFSFCCIILILLVLVQKSKGSLGLGSMGGGTQMLFGGSGGQDLFQKVTWILGAILIFGSLGLALVKSHSFNQASLMQHDIPARSMPTSSMPIEDDSE